MRRLSRAVAVTIAVSVLAACASDPEPQFEADPTPTPTVSTSPTPAEPEPWEEKSDEGAIAFVEHWIDVFNASMSSGNTEELRAISSGDCDSCNNFARLTDSIYAAGGSVRGGAWTVTSTSEPQASDGTTLLSIDITQDPQTIVEAARKKAKRYPGGKVDYLASIQWSNDGWRMLRLDVVQ